MAVPFSVLLRNIVFYMFALLLSGLFVLLVPVGVALPALGIRFTTAYLLAISFLLRVICDLRVEVRGMDRLPAGAAILAPLHQSTWENLFLPLILGDPAMFIKDEITRYPLVGRIAREKDYIPARRTGTLDEIRASFDKARCQAAAGRSILIYPAGRRTGLEMAPPVRRGIAALYAMLDLPCAPIAHNSGLFWRNGSWMRFPGTIIVDVLPPIPPGLPKERFLKSLQDRLQKANDMMLASAPPPSQAYNFAPPPRPPANSVDAPRSGRQLG